jgi:hypothetical protein
MLDGVGGKRYAPADLLQGKRPGSHCTRGCLGPRIGLHGPGKSLPPPGFNPWTVQPVASRYTDWAIPRIKRSQSLLALNWDGYRLPVQKDTQHKAHNSQWTLVLLQKASNVPHLTLLTNFPEAQPFTIRPLRYPRNPPHFMEPEGSLPCSQKP